MPSVILKLKFNSGEVVHPEDNVLIEYSYNGADEGMFKFSVKDDDEERGCFTLSSEGMKRLIEFYSQIKKD
jgi:hypothetical protein